MSRFKFRLLGLEKLGRRLTFFERLLQRGARGELTKSEGRARRRMRRQAPVRTGNLRSRIFTRRNSDRQGYTAGSTAPYALWTEFGPNRRPWLMNTFRLERKALRRAARRIIRRTLARLRGGTRVRA